MKSKRPRSKIRLVGKLLGAAILLLILVTVVPGFFGPAVTISEETTRILGPIDEQGAIDYVEAINQQQSEGVTSENNAAVVLVQVLGPNMDDGFDGPSSQAWREKFFDRLGIPVLPEQGDYLVHSESYWEQGEDENSADGEIEEEIFNSFERSMEGPWSRETSPIVAEWIVANERPLAILAEGVQRERYYFPYVGTSSPPTVVGALLPHLTGSREVARLLLSRTMLRFQEGNVDGAWEDFMTCQRLGRHLASGPSLIESLVGLAIADMSWGGAQRLAQSGALTVEQALHFRQQLESLPPMPQVLDSIDTAERYMILDTINQLASGNMGFTGLAEDAEEGFWRQTKNQLSRISADWNETMKLANAWYDRIVIANRLPTYQARVAAYEELQVELNALGKNYWPSNLGEVFSRLPRTTLGRLQGKLMVVMFSPVTSSVHAPEARSEMFFQLTRLTLALAAYQKDHDAFPESLDKLVPKYIAEVPEDLFIEKPLIYHRTEQGYQVYICRAQWNGRQRHRLG